MSVLGKVEMSVFPHDIAIFIALGGGHGQHWGHYDDDA
jgi:hypothetical protein